MSMTTGIPQAFTQSRSSYRRVFDILDTIAMQNPKGAPGFLNASACSVQLLIKPFPLETVLAVTLGKCYAVF